MNEIVAAAKSGHGRYAKLKREHTQAVVYYALAAGVYRFACPVIIHCHWMEPNRRRDKDNISSGGRKMIHDGLAEAGVIMKDGWKGVAGFTDTFSVVAANLRGVSVAVEATEIKP